MYSGKIAVPTGGGGFRYCGTRLFENKDKNKNKYLLYIMQLVYQVLFSSAGLQHSLRKLPTCKKSTPLKTCYILRPARDWEILNCIKLTQRYKMH
jgi:hypothetical protein